MGSSLLRPSDSQWSSNTSCSVAMEASLSTIRTLGESGTTTGTANWRFRLRDSLRFESVLRGARASVLFVNRGRREARIRTS
jgi:hypothetical protein